MEVISIKLDLAIIDRVVEVMCLIVGSFIYIQLSFAIFSF